MVDFQTNNWCCFFLLVMIDFCDFRRLYQSLTSGGSCAWLNSTANCCYNISPVSVAPCQGVPGVAGTEQEEEALPIAATIVLRTSFGPIFRVTGANSCSGFLGNGTVLTPDRSSAMKSSIKWRLLIQIRTVNHFKLASSVSSRTS